MIIFLLIVIIIELAMIIGRLTPDVPNTRLTMTKKITVREFN